MLRTFKDRPCQALYCAHASPECSAPCIFVRIPRFFGIFGRNILTKPVSVFYQHGAFCCCRHLCPAADRLADERSFNRCFWPCRGAAPRRFSATADIWAAGCILYELAALRPCFTANNPVLLARQICNGQHMPGRQAGFTPLRRLCCKNRSAFWHSRLVPGSSLCALTSF